MFSLTVARIFKMRVKSKSYGFPFATSTGIFSYSGNLQSPPLSIAGGASADLELAFDHGESQWAPKK